MAPRFVSAPPQGAGFSSPLPPFTVVPFPLPAFVPQRQRAEQGVPQRAPVLTREVVPEPSRVPHRVPSALVQPEPQSAPRAVDVRVPRRPGQVVRDLLTRRVVPEGVKGGPVGGGLPVGRRLSPFRVAGRVAGRLLRGVRSPFSRASRPKPSPRKVPSKRGFASRVSARARDARRRFGR